MNIRTLLLAALAIPACSQVRPIRPDPQEFEKLQLMADNVEDAIKTQEVRARDSKAEETETAINALVGQLVKIRAQLRGPVADYKDLRKFRALERKVSKLIGAE
jgi:hypothetical protein